MFMHKRLTRSQQIDIFTIENIVKYWTELDKAYLPSEMFLSKQSEMLAFVWECVWE